MKTRIIWTKMWEDDWFQSLSDNGQKLFLYLITNSRINMSGCYQISDRIISFDTRIKNLEKAKEELSPKVSFYSGWVYLKNAQFYGGYSGKKNEVVIDKELREIPKDIKNTLFSDKDDRVSKKTNTVSSFLDTSINHKSEIINKEGVLGEKKKYSSIDDLKDQDLEEISNEYFVTVEYVKKKKNDMRLWCESEGKSKKNYKATLQRWIRSDIDKGIVKQIKQNEIFKPIIPDQKILTPEEKEKARLAMEKIRENSSFLSNSKSVNNLPKICPKQNK